jgi:hypothetical protein
MLQSTAKIKVWTHTHKQWQKGNSTKHKHTHTHTHTQWQRGNTTKLAYSFAITKSGYLWNIKCVFRVSSTFLNIWIGDPLIYLLFCNYKPTAVVYARQTSSMLGNILTSYAQHTWFSGQNYNSYSIFTTLPTHAYKIKVKRTQEVRLQFWLPLTLCCLHPCNKL